MFNAPSSHTRHLRHYLVAMRSLLTTPGRSLCRESLDMASQDELGINLAVGIAAGVEERVGCGAYGA